MLDKYEDLVSEAELVKYLGRVSKITETVIESLGPNVGIGELCQIELFHGEYCYAEVIAVEEQKVSLMPFENINSLKVGTKVVAVGGMLSINISDAYLGRVINVLGEPLDNKGPIIHSEGFLRKSIFAKPPDILNRKKIRKQITTGVRAIDTFMPVGEGQRLGIFSGSGVGKSTLMGMVARNTQADVNVVALIGERTREVLEFVEEELQDEGLKKSVVVVASSSEPPLARIRAAYIATTIAEYYRDKNLNVMFLFDSITRFAMAQREIGLSIGEVPSSRGYTPSVFSKLPKILERTGNSDKGSITAFYTVLVEGDDLEEPISDAVRGILDGHIVLSKKIAQRNQYPAIDVLQSISRLDVKILSQDRLKLVNYARRLISLYREKEDLISVGAYVSGSNPELDKAIAKMTNINKYLSQEIEQKVDFEKSWEILFRILR